MSTRAENILMMVELDLLEGVEKRIDKRKELLPLTDRKQIKAIIWNLLTSDKYRKIMSYKDFSEIMNILFDRLKLD